MGPALRTLIGAIGLSQHGLPSGLAAEHSLVDRPLVSGGHAQRLERRYREGFVLASALVSLGRALRQVAWMLAIIGSGLGLIIGVMGEDHILGGSAFGAEMVAGGLLFVGGWLLAASAQILLATLDIAINTAPGITDDRKMDLINLSKEDA